MIFYQIFIFEVEIEVWLNFARKKHIGINKGPNSYYNIKTKSYDMSMLMSICS